MWRHKLALLLLFAFLAACNKPDMPSPYHAVDISWQHRNPDFNLIDFTGKSRTVSEFKGKVVVLFFGYTHCPEVCPTTLADLAQVMRQLGKDAIHVQVLFVTLDPERDSPEVLRLFVPSFDSTFLGLYGSAQATADAAKSFGVMYGKQFNKNNYTVDHSDGTYLIGKNGRPILLSPYEQRAEWLVQDIRMLLAIGR